MTGPGQDHGRDDRSVAPPRTSGHRQAGADPDAGPGGDVAGRTEAARPPQRSRLRRIALTAVGWLFLVLGVLGLFLPILQGFLFLAIGLVVLSRVSPRVQRFEAWLRLRSPRIDRGLHQGEKYLRLWRGRLGRRWRRSG